MIQINAAHVDEVIRNLSRTARINDKVANRIVRAEMMTARTKLARMAGKITGLSIAAARRRIVTTGLRKRRRRSWKWAGIRTWGSSLTIHAGRIRLTIRKDTITAGGRHTFSNAFLWRPAGKPAGYLKGQKRRVYVRLGGRRVESANLPKTADMTAVYDTAGKLVAEQVSSRLRDRILAEAIRF